MTQIFVRAGVLSLSLVLTAIPLACDRGGGVKPITEVRQLETPRTAPPATLTSAQRFGFSRPASSTPRQAPFTYTVPQGWTEQSPDQIRMINLRPAGDAKTECYVSVLGGGVDANVNRWRKQMSLPDFTAEELAALVKKPLLGESATYVEFEGSYVGMGSDPQPDYKLLGMVLPVGGNAVFIKMVGPKSVVEAEKAGFDAFCASLQMRVEGEDTASAPAQAASSETASGAEGNESFTWSSPGGWRKSADKPMRIVTYTGGLDGEVECYASVFPDNAGGVEANVNRWAKQINHTPMTAEEIAALPKITMLGQEASLLELEGDFSDSMSGKQIQGAVLFGVIARVPEGSLFVKMVGPASAARAQKQNFLAFCQSFKQR
ncbi:MAG: hypothetical protein K1Y02_20470 [Candidatus Hydrogenedentes bacterium]|nr:hypothetical protein [Candidatus Hydrogenedentota bacterium]